LGYVGDEKTILELYFNSIFSIRKLLPYANNCLLIFKNTPIEVFRFFENRLPLPAFKGNLFRWLFMAHLVKTDN
jgi:hypothetical protein